LTASRGFSTVDSPCWLEVDAAAIERNIRSLRRRVRPAGLIAVVKANAYGVGAGIVARAAERAGAVVLCVYGTDEARALGRRRIPILNLACPFGAEAAEVVRLGLEQSIWDVSTAERLDRAARRRGARVNAHVKIDTGMNRVGVPWARAGDLIKKVISMGGLRLRGAFTSLAERPEETAEQIRRFREACRGFDIPLRHVAATAALGRRAARFDAVRVGLACLGYQARGVRPSVRLRARVVDVKALGRGETCGYGELFRARRPMTIAVLSAGWADGLPRALSNRWRAELRGRTLRVVGRVSANHCYLDATGMRPEVGEVATLLGGRTTSIEQAARVAGTSVYELLTRLPSRLHRSTR
jgi:alanine racemase